MQLSDLALRVLGTLIEKQLATPQSYPLSSSALRTAANQTTNRDPVTDHDEQAIAEGIRELTGRQLVRAAYARRSSTPRYEHLLDAHLEIDEAATAVLAVLALRGPQTVGELRQRTERLHAFAELGDVADVLEGLAAHPFGALVEELPRQPGQKEARWRHLLGTGEPPATPADAGAGESRSAPAADGAPRPAHGLAERVAALEARVAALEAALDPAADPALDAALEPGGAEA